MDLNPRETADLARFIARRHPTRDEVDRIARLAGIALDDTLAGGIEAVWSTVVVEARIQGRTRRLAKVLRRQPDPDPGMAELCALLLEVEPVPASTRLLQASAVVGLIALIAAGALALRDAPDAAAPEAAVPEAAAPEAATPEAAAPEPVLAVATEAPAPVDTPAAVGAPGTPTDDANATPAASDVPAQASALPSTTTPRRRGCKGQAGEIVGYWYAGATAPGAAGDTITVPQDVNVRADYPDKHNGYDARTPVRCTLGAGDRITLGADPILVPGDRYWVPLVATGATSSSTSTP